MMIIDIEIDVLEQVANSTMNVSKNVRESASRTGRIGNEVPGVWQSRSSNQFADTVRETQNRLSRTSEELESLSLAIRRYAETMRRIERENAQRFSGGNS